MVKLSYHLLFLSLTCLIIGCWSHACFLLKHSRRRWNNEYRNWPWFLSKLALGKPQWPVAAPCHVIGLCHPSASPWTLAWWYSLDFIGQSALVMDLRQASTWIPGAAQLCLRLLQVSSKLVCYWVFSLCELVQGSSGTIQQNHLMRWEAFLLPSGHCHFLSTGQNLKMPKMWPLGTCTHSCTH